MVIFSSTCIRSIRSDLLTVFFAMQYWATLIISLPDGSCNGIRHEFYENTGKPLSDNFVRDVPVGRAQGLLNASFRVSVGFWAATGYLSPTLSMSSTYALFTLQ